MATTYWRAVGNAVVPQVAEVVGWMIRELVEAGARKSMAETAFKKSP